MDKAKAKRAYVKPQLRSHGSVEEVTGWTGSKAGEFFGGPQSGGNGGGTGDSASANRIGFRQNGPGYSH